MVSRGRAKSLGLPEMEARRGFAGVLECVTIMKRWDRNRQAFLCAQSSGFQDVTRSRIRVEVWRQIPATCLNDPVIYSCNQMYQTSCRHPLPTSTLVPHLCLPFCFPVWISQKLRSKFVSSGCFYMQFLLIYSLLKIYSVRISASALIRAESVQIWNNTSHTQFISCWYERYANHISGTEPDICPTIWNIY